MVPNYNFQTKISQIRNPNRLKWRFVGREHIKSILFTCVAVMSLQPAKNRETLWPVKLALSQLVRVFVCVRETVCARAYNRTIHAGHPLILTPLLARVLCQCKPMCQVDLSVLLRVCCSGSFCWPRLDNYHQGTQSWLNSCSLSFC